MIILGYTSVVIGSLGVISATIRATNGNPDGGLRSEACGVLWFILAALLLK